MTHKQKLILTTLSFFLLGAILIFIGEIRKNEAVYLGDERNAAGVMLAVEDKSQTVPAVTASKTSPEVKSYAPLSVIPGLTDQKTTSMKAFLRLLFKWGIAIAVILSIVMITYGGFQYMTTDAVFAKSEGRAKINAAIIGLLLALSAWLILQTVDPRILQEPQSKIIN